MHMEPTNRATEESETTMSRSTNAIKLLAKAGIEAARSSEAVSVLPSTLVLIDDPNDDLYCPGVDDPPSAGLLASLRLGWMEGSMIVCVNRGTKEAPIPVVVDGRSRKKGTDIVNAERAAEGLDPMRVDIVFISSDEAYRIMLIGNNRQDRNPLFNAQRWAHHKRVVARRLGKASLSDAERSEARREFAELVGVVDKTIAEWETILENPPEVLAMVASGQISPTDAKEIVRNAPEAVRLEKAVKIAAKKTEPRPNGATKKEVRDEILGKVRPLSLRQLRVLSVRADALGIDEDMKQRIADEDSTIDLDALVTAAMADGFALCSKLMTGEIKPEQLPAPFYAMVRDTMKV